ncbi:hypothetical protein BSM4216_2856 [Bacillus smithii]|nr:hypothetical protein BSM4216_2856 [Bacillus smithii]
MRGRELIAPSYSIIWSWVKVKDQRDAEIFSIGVFKKTNEFFVYLVTLRSW